MRLGKRASAILAILLIWLAGLGAAPAAPRVQLAADEGPYYTGAPISIQVVADGFEEDPQPTVTAPTPRDAQLKLVGVSPSVSSSIQIINGRVSRSKRVRFIYNYRFLATKPGAYALEPFRISQGGHTKNTRSFQLQVGEVPVGGDQRVRLVLPDGPIFVGQRIPVKLEWWLKSGLLDRLVEQQARVPLFDMTTAFRFEDVEAKDTRNRLTINLASGPETKAATIRRENWKGDRYIVVVVERAMIPLKAGEHPIEPASVTVEEGVRWRRDIFGERSATRVRKLRAVDGKRTLTVKDLPATGRPGSFAGAVGNGFSLEVAADRSVVRVGDPIRLDITLRSESEAPTAALPPLAASGLSPHEFRVPEGEVAGIHRDGAKHFEITIRVLDENVREVPPIAYSWFDPESGQYQTAKSRPIALSVGAAQVVSAGDVVRPPVPDAKGRTGEESAPRSMPPAPETAGRKPVITLTVADLAIEKDLSRLLAASGSSLTSMPFQAACYLLGIGLLIMAYFDRRRASVDPLLAARRKEMKQLRDRVAKARTAAELAASLRHMAAITTHVPRQALDPLLGECDALAFAPGGAAREVGAEVRRRARDLAVTMLEGAP